MSLSIVLTCYNEVPIIFNSYETIAALLDSENIEYEIIIVDDGSRAEDREALSEYFKNKPDAKVILSQANEGRGAAVSKGIRAASKEYAGFIDTDLEIGENFLMALYNKLKSGSGDAVIGKRVYKLSLNPLVWIRYIASRTYFSIANAALKLNSLDTETGIKLFRRNRILPVLDCIQDKRWFWDTELIAESLGRGLDVSQIPVVVSKSHKGSSVKIVRDTIEYMRSLFRYRRRRQECKCDEKNKRC